MSKRILVTGGAGFIGSHVCDALLARGHQVLALDNLDPQVHGESAKRPSHLSDAVELIVADVRDRAALESCLDRADVVIHLAAAVGLAQSLYQVERFVDVNVRGTAILLDLVARRRDRIQGFVVASSMSLYGEGRCICDACALTFDPDLRAPADVAGGSFDLRCPKCRAPARPTGTPESARLQSFTTPYAVTKRDQEELALSVGSAYEIPTTALRLFNVYGPRQALSNPYTGVGAIFAMRLRTGRAPVVFEDGGQTRDFTNVRDVAEAFARAAEHPGSGVLNVGRGDSRTISDLGALLAANLGVEWQPEITGKFRKGDIRHCTADTTRLEAALGFRPRITLEEGVRDLVDWAREQPIEDRVDRAVGELFVHGLVK